MPIALIQYSTVIAQSVALTKMPQWPHKCHADPVDHTHIAGIALRDIPLTQETAQGFTLTDMTQG